MALTEVDPAVVREALAGVGGKLTPKTVFALAGTRLFVRISGEWWEV